MLRLMKSRTLRSLLVLLIAGLVLSTSGCSLFKKTAPKAQPEIKAEEPITPPAPPITTPNVDTERPDVPGVPVDFPAEAGVNDLHFDYDKAEIRRDQIAVLDTNLKYFKAHPDVRILIEGHTDERGTVEYNFALGQRRAAAVQDYLMKNGLTADRLFIVSKGKEAPLDPGHSEAAYAKNRRAHFMRVVR